MVNINWEIKIKIESFFKGVILEIGMWVERGRDNLFFFVFSII